jgi:hypothetical protein
MKYLLAASVVLAIVAGVSRGSEDASRGGDGGAGGDGAVIHPPQVPAEQLEAYTRTLTAAQVGLLDELIALQFGDRRDLTPESRATIRADYLKWIVAGPESERTKFWEDLPAQLDRARREKDPTYLSAADKKAGAALPAEVKRFAKVLLSDDVNEYLQARKELAQHGSAAVALVAELAKELKENTHKRARVLSLLLELHSNENLLREKLLRIADEALKRRDEIQAMRKGESKIAVLVSRRLVSSGRNTLPVYEEMCYFSFPRNSNDYKGQVSLMFDNGGMANALSGRMYGGQQNRIKDLGAVEFDSITSAPSAAITKTWKSECSAEVGHVYIEHCKEDRDKLDACFKFKVLELKADNYVIIEWAPIAQEK